MKKLFPLIFLICMLCTTLQTQAATYYVSNSGNDSNNGLALVTAFLTLQHAADLVVAGDNVLVQNGIYDGFDIRDVDGTNVAPITFTASGNNVLINQSGPIRDDGINIENADFIIIDGFIVNDMTGNGNGIRVVQSDHCIIRNCSCDNNAERGIFTGFTDDILIEYNVCTNSIDEHGIYVSNSSDRPVIRYNECYGNNNIGIHMNGDLSAGGDGIISDAQVYGNLLHDNNQAAGINMDGVVNALVYNNVIYNNHNAQGIALFQQDGAAPSSGAKIYNNTIIVPSDGRWGILVTAGANVNTEIYNNIIINQHAWRGCITVESTSQFTSNYNIVNDKMSASGDGSTISLAAWQALGLDLNSSLAPPLLQVFEDPASDDYYPAIASPAIDAGTSLVSDIVTTDILGIVRPQGSAYDIGGYEFESALAVELLSPVQARLLGDAVQVKWATAFEINAAHFQIFRSLNGRDWKSVGRLNANGNTAQTSHYSFVDKEPLHGLSYYKVVEIDQAGNKTTLGMAGIQNDQAVQVNLYPNPAQGMITLIPSDGNSDIQRIAILDAFGREVLLVENPGSYIDCSSLTNGLYWVRVYLKGSSERCENIILNMSGN